MDTYANLRADTLQLELEQRLAAAGEAVDAAIAADGDDAAVLGHLDRAARLGLGAHGRTGVLWAVHPDKGMREAASQARMAFERWRTGIYARPDLLRVLGAIDAERLSTAESRRLRLWLASARIGGAGLDGSGRARMELLQARQSELADAINEAFVADAPELQLTAGELDGLPPSDLARLAPGDAPATWRLPVGYANREVVLTHLRRRDVRERYWRALDESALEGNRAAMAELFEVRREIAHAAGFESWADLRATGSALGSVRAAEEMLAAVDGPIAHATRAWQEAGRAALADELDGDSIRPWDWWRANATLLRGIGADPEQLTPYLELGAVAEGMFRLAREVFGIRVEYGEPGLGWHEDVRTLVLRDDATGVELGTCLWDPWQRPGKMATTMAFMELLAADPARPDGTMPPAVAMLVTMVPRPDDGQPANVSLFDAGVLFHEFGHVLDAVIGSRAGVAFEESWMGFDWVEGPSMFLESWARSAEVVATFARHPETGAAPARDLVDAIADANVLEDVLMLARYVVLGRLDLLVHGPDSVELDAAWRTAHAGSPLPDPSGAFRPMAMSMAAGGYDAVIYGVVYALEIKDDLLAMAQAEGMLSPSFGHRYVDLVLRPGPFVPPTERLAALLGRPVSPAPLVARLERLGEIAAQAGSA